MEAAFAGAIAFAKEERPGVDAEAARHRIEVYAIEVGREAYFARNVREKGEAIARVFFGRHNLAADPDDLEGRRAESFDVPRVLETRRGSCLAVSILIARAASGAGIPAGVARAPGHALVVIGPPLERLYLDPAERGRVRPWADIVLTRPWSPSAGHIYNGRPLAADEVVAQLRANRAALRLAAGNLDGAEKDARAALAVVPDLPEGLVNLAAVMLKRGEAGEADELLKRAHDLLPRSAIVLFNLGLAAAARGQTLEAISYYDGALEADPRMEKARANKEALERAR